MILIFLTDFQLSFLKSSLQGCKIIYNPNYDSEIINEYISDIRVLITYRTSIDDILQMDNLLFVQVYGSGKDGIPADYLTKKGILFKASKGECMGNAVAEYVLMSILIWERNLFNLNAIAKTGAWDWIGRNEISFRSLSCLRVGIVGVGLIGSKVKSILEQHSTSVYELVLDRNEMNDELFNTVNNMDYITVHLQLEELTDGIIGKVFFEAMNDHAVFINTSRAGVVIEEDLIVALKKKCIRGASIDTTSKEPLPFFNPFVNLDNVIITPHCSARTESALLENIGIIVNNIKEVIYRGFIQT